MLLGLVTGAASAAARTSLRDADPLATLARERVTAAVELVVADDPRPLRSARIGPPALLVPARLTRLASDRGATRLDARVVVFATDEAWRGLLPGQRLAATVRLAPPRGGDLTAAALTATGPPEAIGTAPWWQTAAGVLRAGLQAACAGLPPEPGGLLPGLVIGDTSRLDPAVADEFRATGLTHLVAVSGANVAIVLTVVLFVARWCRAGPWLAALVCSLALVGFVILARPSPSVVRAAAMGAVGLLALASGRSRSAAPALAVASVAGLVVDPALAVDPGFVLSVLATGGLVLLAPHWRDALRARGVPSLLAEALAVSVAAQVVCGPVVAALSGEVSLVAVPANLLAAPAVPPATLLGVVAAGLSPLWPEAAAFVAWLASWPARWLVWIADTGASVPDAAVPWPAGVAGGFALAVLTAVVLLLIRWPWPRLMLAVVALGLFLGAAPVRWLAPGWPPPGAVVVACDVGQGDAVVLPARPGEAVVVDAGPDPTAADACLRRLGIRSVPLLVVTHFHADHIGGLDGVLRERRVGTLVLPSFDEPEEGERAVRSRAGEVPIVEVSAGWRFVVGTVELGVLGPAHPITGTRSDANNNSLILRAETRGSSVLLLGDAEVEQQQALLSSVDPATLRAQVLKVAHHGSAYQEERLLDAVDPLVALVSVGADNPYGHPDPGLLDRLTRDGTRVLRTDLAGDVAVVAGPDGRIGVVTHPA